MLTLDLAAILARLPRDEGEGYTTDDIAKAQGCSKQAARELIRKIDAAGMVERLSSKPMRRIDGKVAQVTSYVFKRVEE